MCSGGNNAALRPCLGCTNGEEMPMEINGAGGREQWAASGEYGGRSVAAEIRVAGSVENRQERS